MLNALRHQRKNHKATIITGPPFSLCSTPCGINGKTTPLRFPKTVRSYCAQRLAASTEKPLAAKIRPVFVDVKCSTPCGINGKTTFALGCINGANELCSTPCGINGKTTGNQLSKGRLVNLVLNALRHQRKTTHCVSDLSVRTCCVLNALRHQRKNHRRPSAVSDHPESAQRLAASTEKPQAREGQGSFGMRGAQRLAASTEKPLAFHRILSQAG